MGITNDDYFEKDEYMSVSAFKMYEKCEVLGLEGFSNDKSSALLFGSYIDAYVEGTLDKFITDNPDMFVTRIAENESTVSMLKAIDEKYVTRNDTLVAKLVSEAKELYPECFDVKTTIKSDFNLAQDICDYIDADERIQQFLSGDKQTIMTGKIEGVPFKIKMDSYAKSIAISDLKVMRSVTDSRGNYVDFISQWGYDLQLSAYQEIVFQNTGEKLPCYIVAVTKETPINSVIVQIPQSILDSALYRMQSSIKRLYDVKMGTEEPVGCGICKSCISKRTVTPIISMLELINN